MDDLIHVPPSRKQGHEALSFEQRPAGAYLSDFWAWSVSDLLSNATRGRLAEFIVGTALGMRPDAVRDEWSAFDLETSSGIKVEVKSAAYVQSWKQHAHSTIAFSIKAARFWSAKTNVLDPLAKRHADVYVFCLLHHKVRATIDPLKLEQWSFYVLHTQRLESYERSRSSITLASLAKLTERIGYLELQGAVAHAYEEQPGSE